MGQTARLFRREQGDQENGKARTKCERPPYGGLVVMSSVGRLSAIRQASRHGLFREVIGKFTECREHLFGVRPTWHGLDQFEI